MSYFEGISHRYLAQSAPACELAPWSVNRTVNKLMKIENTKFSDHPVHFHQLADSEPRDFDDSFCNSYATPNAFGHQEIPALLKTIRRCSDIMTQYHALRKLADAIQDPEKAQQALRGAIDNLLTETLNSYSVKIVLASLNILEILAEQPQAKMIVAKNEKLQSRMKLCFDRDWTLVRDASKTLLALSTNYTAVEELLKAGWIQVILGKLTEIAANEEMGPEEEETLEYMLKTLSNLVEFSREAKIDAIVHGAFQLRHLYSHTSSTIREDLAEFFNLLAYDNVGMQGMVAHNIKGTLLKNFKLTSKEKMTELSSLISSLLVTSTVSSERLSLANHQFIDELFSILTLRDSPKLSIVQLLTNLAEVREMRSRIQEQLTSCFPSLAGYCGEDVTAAIGNLKLVLDKELPPKEC